MALNSVSSDELSFPALASPDSSHHSGIESPPLWKHSQENVRWQDYNRSFKRLIIGKDDDDDQRKSFSYVEMRKRWTAEEKMDMLWEDLNEELPPRSQSLRIEPRSDGGEKKSSVFADESPVVGVGCGMKLLKKTPPKNKKSPNMLVLIRVLKNLLLLRSFSQRSPAKTHPR